MSLSSVKNLQNDNNMFSVNDLLPANDLFQANDLLAADLGEEYIIREVLTEDEELNAFLFSLGCYSGEPITVVSRKRNGCIVSVKDARYHIDRQLAKAILV